MSVPPEPRDHEAGAAPAWWEIGDAMILSAHVARRTTAGDDRGPCLRDSRSERPDKPDGPPSPLEDIPPPIEDTEREDLPPPPAGTTGGWYGALVQETGLVESSAGLSGIPGRESWSVVSASDPWQAAPSCASGREIAKAMRPFKGLVESTRGESVLNEEATADQAARDGLWIPVFHPRRERRLDLDVVLDDDRFTVLLRLEAERLIDVVASIGIFRDVRIHTLDTDSTPGEDLVLRRGHRSRRRLPAENLAVPAHTGRRLIMMLTTGVGEAWHTESAQRLMATWGRSCPLAVVHLLPEELWYRTGVQPCRGKLRAAGGAVANDQYAGTGSSARTVRVPVLEVDARQLHSWAAFVAGTTPEWHGAVMSCPTTPPSHEALRRERPDAAEEHGAKPSAADLVGRFRATASRTAFHLSVLLAAAPLSRQAIQIVQRNLLPVSRSRHLAELVGSDLLRLAGTRDERSAASHDVLYDFVEGVREELLAAGSRSETGHVLVTLADHLGEHVHALRHLRDVVFSPHDATVPELPTEAIPLLRSCIPAIRVLGPPYALIVSRLDRAIKNVMTIEHDHKALPDTVRIAPVTEIEVTRPPIEGQSAALTPVGVSVNVHAIDRAENRKPGDPPSIWNVPPRNPNFIGRKELLTNLHKRLSTGTTAVLPEALHGMGGVGKSQIANEYTYLHCANFDVIWWIPAESLTLIRQSFVELAARLGLNVSDPNIAISTVREALRLGRPYGNWLIVFDNAEDPEEVQRFFPTSGPGKILVTSRNAAWSGMAHSTLEVDVFTREESRGLLRRRGPELNDEAADDLADILGDLPLAIEQAAVWLAETGMQVPEYLQLFQQKSDELLSDASTQNEEHTVAAAWNVSLDRLRQTHPGALRLLQVCAFYAPEPIPRTYLAGRGNIEGPPELIETISDPIALSRAIRAINQYALAKVNHRDNTIVLHRLVQRVLIDRLSAPEIDDLKHCAHLLLAHADPGMPDSSSRWQEYTKLLPHVLSSGVEECDQPWPRQLILNLIDFQFRWGDNKGFRALARRAVETWDEKLGPEDEQTLAARLRLGRALRIFGEYSEAYEHHVQARDILLQRLGTDHERTLEAQGYIGADLRYLGNFSAALELDRQSLEILSRRFGPDDPLTLEQAHLYAIDWRLVGDPWKARDLDRETHRRKAEQFGDDHLSTLSTFTALNIDEMECGRYVQARDAQRAHTQRFRALYGDSHPGTIACIDMLSVMERKAGEHQIALELSHEAMELLRTRFGDDYPDTVTSGLNHAVSLRHNEALRESVEVGTAARERYLKLLGPRHPNTPTADVNLAVSLRLMGRTKQARELNEAALTTLTELLGTDHPRRLVCAINLASDLFTLGEAGAAYERDIDTLERARRVLGEEHPTTLACALNLSLDMRALNRDTEADALLAETLDGYRQALGQDHPATSAATEQKRADCDIYPIPI